MRPFLILLGALALGACANVAPYQRARLAHPSMAPGDDTVLGRDHMQSVQEGALGGSVAASSGCGCN